MSRRGPGRAVRVAVLPLLLVALAVGPAPATSAAERSSGPAAPAMSAP